MAVRNQTKNKGDAGLGFVMAKLMANNIPVALPVSEHLPFDVIAISLDGQTLLRISVKYRAKYRGSIEIALRSVWSNSKGVHYNHLKRREVDAHAIYCPDTKECYFVRDDEIITKNVFRLRIDPTKIKDKRTRFARDYENPNRIFNGK